MTRVPPVFFCPMCEIKIKIDGLRSGHRAQYIEKRCSECVTAEASALTGADRAAGTRRTADPLKG